MEVQSNSEDIHFININEMENIEMENVQRKNLARIASPDEIELHNQACVLLRELDNSFANNLDLSVFHVKQAHTQEKLKAYEIRINQFLVVLNGLDARRQMTSKKKKGDNNSYVRTYNSHLNKLSGIFLPTSPLKNLLGINEQYKYVSKKEEKTREYIDVFDGMGKIVGKNKEEYPWLLHLKGPKNIGGGRTEFESPQACLDYLKACMEQRMSWKANIEEGKYIENKTQIYGNFQLVRKKKVYVLKIPSIGLDSWVRSDCPKLRHILCGGNPPKVDKKAISKDSLIPYTSSTFKILHPVYAEFLELAEKRIKQIVSTSHNDDSCPYDIIHCCRIEPVCSGETFCLKPKPGNSKCVSCKECNMELCAGGCGKVYHGETPCDISLDEASDSFIQQSSKPCPQCRVLIHKHDGCNHMTCTCESRCEFCWVCGEELPRDENGRYSTAMHFRPERFGIGIQGGCNQFDHLDHH